MEPSKVPVFARENCCLCLNGPVSPQSRQKRQGEEGLCSQEGPESKGAKIQSFLLGLCIWCSFYQGHTPETSPSSLLLRLRSHFIQWCLFQEALFGLSPIFLDWGRWLPWVFTVPESLPSQLCPLWAVMTWECLSLQLDICWWLHRMVFSYIYC